MSWGLVSESLERGTGNYYEEAGLALGNAAEIFSAEFQNIGPDPSKDHKYVLVEAFISAALTGIDVNVNLYGVLKPGGTKVLLASNVVAAITGTTPSTAKVDLNEYIAMAYYLGALTDADETAKTITFRIHSASQS